jgi:hypothetical protein
MHSAPLGAVLSLVKLYAFLFEKNSPKTSQVVFLLCLQFLFYYLKNQKKPRILKGRNIYPVYVERIKFYSIPYNPGPAISMENSPILALSGLESQPLDNSTSSNELIRKQ